MEGINTMNEIEVKTKNEIKERGKGLLWKNISERVEYKASDGLTYEFVDYWNKLNCVRVWEKSNESNVLHLIVKNTFDFSVEDLKTFGVWDLLSEEVQKSISTNDFPSEVISQKLQKSQKDDTITTHKRKSSADYVGIPREATCKKCGKVQAMAPAYVINRATAKGIDVHEFVKEFVCLECNGGQRGKKANPKYANYPKVMKCSHPECKVEYPQQPSMTEKIALSKGLTLEKYCNEWKCKEHRPTKVHHFTQERLDREARGEITPPKNAKKKEDGVVRKRGRAASDKYKGMPKGYVCCIEGCGCFQKMHPSLVMTAAKTKGITVDEMYKNWKCKLHRKG